MSKEVDYAEFTKIQKRIKANTQRFLPKDFAHYESVELLIDAIASAVATEIFAIKDRRLNGPGES